MDGDDGDFDDDDDDMIDDDTLEDEADSPVPRQKVALRTKSIEENQHKRQRSPDIQNKKALRHAATISAQHPDEKSQQKSQRKARLMVVQDPVEEKGDGNYSPHNVVAKMLMKKDRKIPGSVYKPHAEEVVLLQSVALGQPQPSARVFFPYPKYCYKDNPSANDKNQSKGNEKAAA